MTARLLFAGAAALSITCAASAADPSKPESRDSGSPASQQQLVLASVDVKAPAPDTNAQTPAPTRHRTARVTTCRCGGDVQPQADDTASE